LLREIGGTFGQLKVSFAPAAFFVARRGTVSDNGFEVSRLAVLAWSRRCFQFLLSCPSTEVIPPRTDRFPADYKLNLPPSPTPGYFLLSSQFQGKENILVLEKNMENNINDCSDMFVFGSILHL